MSKESSFERAVRAMKCRRCGSTTTVEVEGKAGDLDRFVGVKYKVCTGCGHEEPRTGRRPRRTL